MQGRHAEARAGRPLLPVGCADGISFTKFNVPGSNAGKGGGDASVESTGSFKDQHLN